MLTQQEKDFLEYWEVHRDREGRLPHQLMAGLPLGLCFGLPILVVFIFRSWYKWLPFVTTEDLVVVALGVIIIVLFFSVFRQRFLWEQREQQFRELKAKAERKG
jgi:hypothetical protein